MADDKATKILEAAAAVFFRYGYQRTTMGDLAKAAGISRPALYLRFCNKERIFETVCRRFTTQILTEIRSGMTSLDTPQEKLRFAFELWAVRPFILMADSPDAKDLANCGFAFAEEAVNEGYAAFEAELLAILTSIHPSKSIPGTSPAEIAHILASTARGFKASAHSAEELRGMIDGLLKIVLAALN